MSTTTTTTAAAAAKSSASSLATSAKFKAFALTFALTAPVLYVLCDILSLPLFTYHPATNRVDLGWAPGRSGEGPAMYWYGWTATVLIGCAVLGWLATLVPENRAALFMVLLTPVLVAGTMMLIALLTNGAGVSYLHAGIAVVVAAALCGLATLLTEETSKKLVLTLLWVLPLLAFIPLFISLRPFWEKGGWW